MIARKEISINFISIYSLIRLPIFGNSFKSTFNILKTSSWIASGTSIFVTSYCDSYCFLISARKPPNE